MGRAGIIYIMTTSVQGLVKIGKTDDFKNRMNFLEQNGYWNVSGLHPFYAVKVKNYDEKEKLIHTIFSKSQVANSELFALDKEVAKRMLESFEGEQIYPQPQPVAQPAVKRQNMSTDTPTFVKFTGSIPLPFINWKHYMVQVSKQAVEVYGTIAVKNIVLDKTNKDFHKKKRDWFVDKPIDSDYILYEEICDGLWLMCHGSAQDMRHRVAVLEKYFPDVKSKLMYR